MSEKKLHSLFDKLPLLVIGWPLALFAAVVLYKGPPHPHVEAAEDMLLELGGEFADMSGDEIDCAAKMLLASARARPTSPHWCGHLPDLVRQDHAFLDLHSERLFYRWDRARSFDPDDWGMPQCVKSGDRETLLRTSLPALLRAGLVEHGAFPASGESFSITQHGRSLMLAFEAEGGAEGWQNAVAAQPGVDGGTAFASLPMKPSRERHCS